MTSIINELLKKEVTWIKSSDDVYTAELELPGFSKKDVSLTSNSETLSVKAKNEQREKSFSISLNDLVSPEDITCKMSNGLLTITMPKKQVKQSLKIKIA